MSARKHSTIPTKSPNHGQKVAHPHNHNIATRVTTIAENFRRLEETMLPMLQENGLRQETPTDANSQNQGGSVPENDASVGDRQDEGKGENSQSESDGESLHSQILSTGTASGSKDDGEWVIGVPDAVRLELVGVDSENAQRYAAQVIITNQTGRQAIFKMIPDCPNYRVNPHIGHLPERGGTVVRVEIDLLTPGDKNCVTNDTFKVLIGSGITPKLMGEDFEAYWETFEVKHADKITTYKIDTVLIEEELEASSPKSVKFEDASTKNLRQNIQENLMRAVCSPSTDALQQNVNSIRCGLSEATMWGSMTVYLIATAVMGMFTVRQFDDFLDTFSNIPLSLLEPEPEPEGWFSWIGSLTRSTSTRV